MNVQTTVPELQRRLIFVLLWPAVSICRRFRVPLDVLEGLTRLAYYEELRRNRGATQAEVADIFGTSLRTVVGIQKRYTSDFLNPEYETELARRVEEALTVGEHTVDSLAGSLDESALNVDAALQDMVAAGRARVEGEGRYSVSEAHRSLVEADLLSRVDGLKHQLEVLVAAVMDRFFNATDAKPSVARTLSFRGTEAGVQSLIDGLIRELRLRAIDTEEDALRSGGHQQYGLAQYGLTMALAATKRSPGSGRR